MKNIGYHVNVKTLLSLPDEYFENHKVFQVMVGSPQTLTPGSTTDLAIFKQRHPDVEVIVHTSYPVNLSKSPAERTTMNTLAYLINFAKELDKIGVKYMVTHVGARSETDDLKQSALYMWNSCAKWLMATNGCSIHLLLECDSGSKKNTKTGHMKFLNAVIRKLNDPRVRMCYDVEHAFANGFDFSEIDKYIDLIEVVHLNSIPEKVEFGGHLDRHTDTSFYESKVKPDVWLDKFLAYNKEIPMIMEFSPDRVEENYKWLEEEYARR